MNNIQIESWVFQIIDQLNAGSPIEDSRVEIKSQWIPAEKAARRIAAHANAARGQSILWIIGLDEAGKIIGAAHEELANWYPQVASHFDGPTPTFTPLNVYINNKVVVALFFETDRAPYVIKCSGNGPSEREIPWREGTRTRSARRDEIIRILAPLQKLPRLEILDAIAYGHFRPNKPGVLNLLFKVTLYAETYQQETIVIPAHKCQGKFKLASPSGIWNPLYAFQMETLDYSNHSIGISRNPTIISTGYELIINGPGRISLHTRGNIEYSENLGGSSIETIIELLPAMLDIPIQLEVSLYFSPCDNNPNRWVLSEQTPIYVE
ncbi:MAG: ATP-binding protein [Dehalobacter sp.]|nr:ATP-binding protein [Dehalobacter sp.]